MDSDERQQCREQQIEEIEMLLCMYPEEGAIMFDTDFNTWKTERSKSHTPLFRTPPEPPLSLPPLPPHTPHHRTHLYPLGDVLELCVEDSVLSRGVCQSVEDQLLRCAEECQGSGCLLSIAPMAQQLLDDLASTPASPRLPPKTPNTATPTPPSTTKSHKTPPSFSREFFLSHHIYNKHKRKNVVDWARELELSGFVAAGKPGVIVVEGESRNVAEFASRVKSLTWQWLRSQLLQTFPCSTPTEIDANRVFQGKFEEVAFATGNGSTHMDRSQLQAYLIAHNLGEHFKTVLGME